jgi:hypothetical protein
MNTKTNGRETSSGVRAPIGRAPYQAEILSAALEEWDSAGFDLTGYQPAKSMHYYPECKCASASYLVGYAAEMDDGKLFHISSSNCVNRPARQVSWLYENGPKAVAILRRLSIPLVDDCANWRADDCWKGRAVFTVRVERHHGHKIWAFGDCSELCWLD